MMNKMGFVKWMKNTKEFMQRVKFYSNSDGFYPTLTPLLNSNAFKSIWTFMVLRFSEKSVGKYIYARSIITQRQFRKRFCNRSTNFSNFCSLLRTSPPIFVQYWPLKKITFVRLAARRGGGGCCCCGTCCGSCCAGCWFGPIWPGAGITFGGTGCQRLGSVGPLTKSLFLVELCITVLPQSLRATRLWAKKQKDTKLFD